MIKCKIISTDKCTECGCEEDVLFECPDCGGCEECCTCEDEDNDEV